MSNLRTREELEAILLEDPFGNAARLEYARLLQSDGDLQRAMQQLEILHKQNPSAEVRVLRARCLLQAGRPDEARQSYEEARGAAGFVPCAELEDGIQEPPEVDAPALTLVAPRAKLVSLPVTRKERIGFADVGGMEELKKTLRMQIIEPFLRPTLFARFRKTAGGGILLYGPPGCGKTLIARAIATECGAAFLHVGISEILNLWLGESERNLAGVFNEARQQRPAVLFFDEIDALAFSRSKSRSDTMRTIVNEFLAQLDGFDNSNRELLVLAATNMPWDVDPAMKRPGRFSRQVFVPPPDEAARLAILQIKLREVPTGELDLSAIARATEHFSGADLDGVIERSKEHVLEEIVAGGTDRAITQGDLLYGLEQTLPSTLEWLRTVGNLIRYGADQSYRDVQTYLRKFHIH